MFKLMLVAGCGGFIGTCLRFLVNQTVLYIWKAPFPVATFIINIVGSLLLGIFFGYLGRNGIVSPKLNALLIVGVCGGFTTFSTFAKESLTLASDGLFTTSFLYVVASVVLGIMAVWFGISLTR